MPVVTDTWKGAASGAWSDAGDWSLDAAPMAGDDVVIDTASPLTVTFDIPALSIGSLQLVDDALTLIGGPLTVTGAATLTNATINGAWPIYTEGATTVDTAAIGGDDRWYNTGVVTQSGGPVTIGDSSGETALINNEAGATWTISDTSGLLQGTGAGSHFYNAGLFQKTLGSGIALITADFISVGTIASAANGDIEFDGATSRLSGTYIGAGMVDYGPDGVATIGNVQVTQASCQTNWGVVRLVGVMTMYDGSSIMNAQGASWDFAGDSSLVLAAGQSDGPDINGTGAIAKTAGTGTSVVSIDVASEGAVVVDTGTLAFEGTSATFSGPISGAGVFELDSAAATIASGASLSVVDWTLAGGVTTLGQSLTYAGAFEAEGGATLALRGRSLGLTQAANLAGLMTRGSGILRLLAGGKVSGLEIGGATTVIDNGFVTQSGGDVTVGDTTATDAATLRITAGGVWDIDDASDIRAGADPASAIVISGAALFEKTGAGASVVASPITNNSDDVSATALGGIEVAAGSLDLTGRVGGTGADNIVGAATLEFDAAVTAGQTIDFSGGGGTLDLTDLAGFHGGIAGFDTVGSGDSLLIGGGWAFDGGSHTSTSTTLNFAMGASEESLTLAGNYLDGNFLAENIGGGVLKVMFVYA